MAAIHHGGTPARRARDLTDVPISRRALVQGAIAATAATAAARVPGPFWGRETALAHAAGTDNAVLQWNSAALAAIRVAHIGPPMVARALAILHTCIYDAWTAYAENAAPTRPNGITKLRSATPAADKAQAVSFAAYRALVDLFPALSANFDALLTSLGYSPADASIDTTTPAGIGTVAAAAVIAFRHTDGSNQLGLLTPSGVPYADYTGYVPVNTPYQINDPNRWQPLLVGTQVQTYVAPQWGHVIPFALTSADQFPAPAPQTTPFGPGTTPSSNYVTQAQTILAYSAGLTDTQKVIAEYWADGPHSELPPGHWNLFAQWVSARDNHTLDQDVQLFFALTNALLDASIVCWNAKRVFDSMRPITAIQYLYSGHKILAWAGPYQGTQLIDGSAWKPYQPITVVTPPFPEYYSGHSTFSAAGATILALFTGSDAFGGSYTQYAGTSRVEPRVYGGANGTTIVQAGTPATNVTLTWPTFSAAADEAGISRRYGGIHFMQGDLAGRAVGRIVGAQAWFRAQAYINGS